MELIVPIAVGLSLAWVNGANDNFKGVATLYGSGVTTYRVALLWATLSTFAGSICALLVARGLLAAFSGRGLVPTGVSSDPQFALAVTLAAGMTVLIATRFGIPVSTTHAILGGLVGAGIVTSPTGLTMSRLVGTFLTPLLLSPILSAVLALGTYLSLRRLLPGSEGGPDCLCVGIPSSPEPIAASGTLVASAAVPMPTIRADRFEACDESLSGGYLAVRLDNLRDWTHFLSAGAVGFARGLNDTPKIAALLLVGLAFPTWATLVLVAAAMAIGGVVQARRVARALSFRITPLDHRQGLVSNLVTSSVVLLASVFGLPVSTTHVSCGSLFGMGMATGRGQWGFISGIVLAWALTLPAGALLGASAATLLGSR